MCNILSSVQLDTSTARKLQITSSSGESDRFPLAARAALDTERNSRINYSPCLRHVRDFKSHKLAFRRSSPLKNSTTQRKHLRAARFPGDKYSAEVKIETRMKRAETSDGKDFIARYSLFPMKMKFSAVAEHSVHWLPLISPDISLTTSRALTFTLLPSLLQLLTHCAPVTKPLLQPFLNFVFNSNLQSRGFLHPFEDKSEYWLFKLWKE